MPDQPGAFLDPARKGNKVALSVSASACLSCVLICLVMLNVRGGVSLKVTLAQQTLQTHIINSSHLQYTCRVQAGTGRDDTSLGVPCLLKLQRAHWLSLHTPPTQELMNILRLSLTVLS